MKDKIFLRKAAQGDLAEVKYGQLAAEKASSEDVKRFGAKMISDHTMLSNEMKPIAEALGVRLPKQMNKTDQSEYEKLSALSGTDFDQEYMLYMVTDHREDIKEFHAEAAVTQDADLKAAVEKAETIIREHEKMVVRMCRAKGYILPGESGKVVSSFSHP